MSEIKRFDPERFVARSGEVLCMVEAGTGAAGEWVKSSDHASTLKALEDERDRTSLALNDLIERNRGLTRFVEGQKVDIDGLLAERDELKRKMAEAIEQLSFIYDKWENGDPCYEDPEDFSGPLGNAFRLTADEEIKILAILETLPPLRALDAQEVGG